MAGRESRKQGRARGKKPRVSARKREFSGQRKNRKRIEESKGKPRGTSKIAKK